MKRATIRMRIKNGWSIISIHALVKRATTAESTMKEINSISIHALVKRATKMAFQNRVKCKFQSTPS